MTTDQKPVVDPFAVQNAAPLPAGFEDVQAVSAIEYEDLAEGRVAKYQGSRVVKSKTPVFGRTDFTMHEFSEDDAIGWGLWGNASLDLKLKAIPVGATVWIRYAGKIPHPTAGLNKDGSPKQTLHQFQVAIKRTKPSNTKPAPAPSDFSPADFETEADGSPRIPGL
jgi:hypothetical protein